MFTRILAATVTLGWALNVPIPAAAQTPAYGTAVTFNVPVNLTQLSPDLERVRVICMVGSEALNIPSGMFGVGNLAQNPPSDEAPVVLGKVERTMQVVFPIAAEWLQNATGKEAQYYCALQGFSRSLQRWELFDESSNNAAFRLIPTPPVIEGTFVW